MSHIPDLLKELGNIKINLALSGHTHGGQIRFPSIGPLVALSSFQRAYNKGLYNYHGYYDSSWNKAVGQYYNSVYHNPIIDKSQVKKGENLTRIA